MSAILPNSIVHLLKGVPLEEGYDDTFYFDRFGQTPETKQTQANYFLSNFGKRTFTQLTYVKPNENRIRIEASADTLRDYNYMMFQNTNYGEKWFYAFITKVEYVNNAVTEIEFSIDAIQTWYFDISFEQSFIDREHSETDGVGDNVIDENLAFGDLMVSNKKEELYMNKTVEGVYIPMYMAVVFYIPNNDKKAVLNPNIQPTRSDPGVTPEPAFPYVWWFSKYTYTDKNFMIPWRATIANGIYFGSTYFAIPFDTRTDISYNQGGYTLTYLDDTRNKLVCLLDAIDSNDIDGTIVNVCLIPTDVWLGEFVNGDYNKTGNFIESTIFVSSDGTTNYTPKNKKMYCYPYKRIVVSNNTGGTNEFKWEFCKETLNRSKVFDYNIKGTAIPNCEVSFIPQKYRGFGRFANTNDYENALVLNDFPQLSWSEDSFSKWWAQNRDTFNLSMISSAVSGVGSIATGGLIAQNNIGNGGSSAVAGARVGNVAFNAFDNIIKTSFPRTLAKNTPDQPFGNLSCSALKTKLERIGYTLYELSINANCAEAIDNYFTMFGYAMKKIKVPNVFGGGSVRPYWNYIKTNGAKIHGYSQLTTDNIGLTSEDLKNIVAIFDHGITFWNRNIAIGDYNHNNAPV